MVLPYTSLERHAVGDGMTRQGNPDVARSEEKS
jgi:hypothetical protein